MIFSSFKTYRDIKSGIANPTDFGKEALLGIVKTPLLIFTVAGFVVLALFFILGWTELLTKPLGFFRVVFVLVLIPFSILQIIIWRLFKGLKRVIGKSKKTTEQQTEIIDVEIK